MVVQRLFFALWPDEAFCEALFLRAKPWLAQANGRQVARENLHITLAFLGNVDEAQQICVQAMADDISLPSFELSLNSLGHWSRSRVVWAGCHERSEPFIQLASGLQQGAFACGLPVDKRPPVAHLTLRRKVTRAAESQLFEPLSWQVEQFHLIASKTMPEGPVYTRLKSWALAAE